MLYSFARKKKKIKILDEYREEIEVSFEEFKKLLTKKESNYKLSDLTLRWLYDRSNMLKDVAYQEFDSINNTFLTEIPNISTETRRHTYTEPSKNITVIPKKTPVVTESFKSKIKENRRNTFDGTFLPKI
tara:strand:- start:1024 stop:1413 length:390 start_codon:yes stop_codon:yes gene_type:complete